MEERDTILIVDDMEINRAILRGAFEKDYNLLEAAGGEQALLLAKQYRSRIAAVLLDLVMPGMDGFTALAQLRSRGFLNEMPVVVITAESSVESEMRAFDLGASDMIGKPFAPYVVRRRVQNLLELYRRKNRQQQLIEQQAAQLRVANEAMVDALSSIIEYRSAETGRHVQRIRMFTRVLLEDLARSCPEYGLDEARIQVISSAAAMHDIGKIAIPDSILNKPGPLTAAEYEQMKEHTVKGCEMLAGLEKATDRDYLRCAYNICRSHHERWNGAGYPDGLQGDAIPLEAQAVSVADCYDALTTDRVYKQAIPPEEAFQMILNGECGQFSPRLMESFKQVRAQFAALARRYADGAQPGEGVLELRGAALPPAGQDTAQDTARLGQLKYFALLRYLGATVMEADLTTGAYHLVYLASNDFGALKSGGDFEGALRRFAQTAVHPDDREAVEALASEELRRFLTQGVPRSTRTYRVRDLENNSWVRRRFTLLRVDPGDPRLQTVLLIWQDLAGTPGRALAQSAAQEREQRALGRLLGGVQQCRNDRQFTLVQMSRELRELLGYTEQELAERFHGHYLELIYPPDRDEAMRQTRQQLEQGDSIELEYRVQAKGGGLLWMLEKSWLTLGENGEETLVGVMIDVTRTREAEEELRRSLQRHRIILEQTDDVIFEWDIPADRVDWPANWEKKFGYEPIRENFSRRVRESSHVHPEDMQGFEQLVQKIAAGAPCGQGELRIADAAGRYRWYRVRVTTQFNDLGQAATAVGVLIDVDKEHRTTLALKRQAEQDELTGVYNRSAGRRRIEELLERQGAAGGALVVLDIDDFKRINDTYGHLFGDAVLQSIAAELRRQFRARDVVSRIGGDEFLVYLPGAGRAELVQERLEKLLRGVEGIFCQGPEPCKLSCSAGAALYPLHGRDYEDLFRKGDQALYAAKARGKKGYAIYDPAAMSGCALPGAGLTAGTRIESNAAPAPQGDLVSGAFHILCQTPDLDEAVNALLALVGSRLGASRAYVFEDDASGESSTNTYEWCAPGTPPQKQNLQQYRYEQVGGKALYLSRFNEEGVFYCPDRTQLDPQLAKALEEQGVFSVLQCAIRDESGFKGFVGFDDCVSPRLWVKEQIEVLSFVAQLLSVSLLKKRAEEKAQAAARDLQAVLDQQDAWVYVVDPETMRLEYLNAKARMLMPAAQPGMVCYKALLGRAEPCGECPGRRGLPVGARAEIYNPSPAVWAAVSHRPLRWNGRPSWLLTCQDITPYKQS